MNTATHYYMAGMAGMGTASPGAESALHIGTSAAGSIVPVAIGPSVAAILGISTTIAVPIVGVAIAGISLAIEAILNSGCGQTCIVTSQWANQAEAQLQQNIAAYFAIPIPRPQSVQQIAMANFKAIWNTLVQQCSQPNLGGAGQACIADRKDGGCKWKALPPAYPGEPAEGACWNWWNGYYYPIANDPNVVADSLVAASPAAGVANALAQITGININPDLLLGLVLVGLGLVVFS